MKKFLSVSLAAVLSVGLLAACTTETTTTSTTPANTATEGGETTEGGDSTVESTTPEEVTNKPESISIMVDGTLVTKENGQAEFIARFEEITGVKLEVTQPDHDAFYDVLGQTVASGSLPDVVLLGSTYYAGYAGEGILWDHTDAYENSNFLANGNVKSPEVIEGQKIDGRLYGIPVMRGNGSVMYIKQAWLDNLDMEAPTNYEEYLEMIEAFSTLDPDGNGVDGDTVAISHAGLIGVEAPYINYLPEFYQDAYPSFYPQEDGTWVDGFEEESMKAALERIRDAYEAGYIDRETLTQGTSDARNKFYEDRFGVFTYWAGKWNTNLKVNLEANGLSGELVALPPFEGYQYIERLAPAWSITQNAEDPQAVFDVFFETIFDGGEGSTLFTYGVKGVHWDDKAETVLDREFQEGEFHFLPNLENPDTVYTTAHVDPLLSVIKFNGEDPGYSAIAPEAHASQEVFNENSVQAPMLISTPEMARYNGDLTTLKNSIIANIITQGADYDAEMQRYVNEGGREWSEMIVESLNNQ